jgi:hypothetical protein
MWGLVQSSTIGELCRNWLGLLALASDPYYFGLVSREHCIQISDRRLLLTSVYKFFSKCISSSLRIQWTLHWLSAQSNSGCSPRRVCYAACSPSPSPITGKLEIALDDFRTFELLQKAEQKLKPAMVLFAQRGKNRAAQEVSQNASDDDEVL